MREKLDDVSRREGILERLKHSLQALSLEAAEQVRLFPDFVHKNDALVLDFDHWRLCAVGNYGKEMTPAQLESLQAIDAHIGTATPSDTAVWDEDGLYTNPYWRELRVLATACLGSFGWPREIPPSYAHEYVRGVPD
jgi:hypothetical protein